MEIFKTSDLALAAYLTLKGLGLISAARAANGRFEFVLDDPKGEAKELSLEFFSSEFCEYDNKIRSLKKILYSN
jgi:hypothetical protein